MKPRLRNILKRYLRLQYVIMTKLNSNKNNILAKSPLRFVSCCAYCVMLFRVKLFEFTDAGGSILQLQLLPSSKSTLAS